MIVYGHECKLEFVFELNLQKLVFWKLAFLAELYARRFHISSRRRKFSNSLKIFENLPILLAF